MRFDIHTPCGNCPFRTDCLKGWLGKKRATEIADVLRNGQTFSCHKTTNRRVAEQHCAGALIMLMKSQGGFSGMQSIACALKLLDYKKLNMDAPVFESPTLFIRHHKGGRAKRAAILDARQGEG